ncbi:MAG: RsmB/NOP family class I SAM-dependent RNA methyltransferase, partial [Anaeroplasmataceae bacterium]|nr:RsmB/NOP family class I SAM-dependent RNA methyltransferase [Anaeroplasmataceae bacterium]
MKDAFLNRMKQYLSLEEFQSFMKSYQEEPQRGLRLNNIDADTFFNHLKMPVEKISYDPDGYYLLDQDKYGNHPYHHLGAFYLQEPSAMAPVNMYSFKGNELVLDLCAAPGGKSSQLARRLDQGILFSNDPNYKRSKTLFSNLERLGFSNVVVLNETPQHLASELQGLFDVILVDAPCSGEGMMRKDEEALNMWNEGLALECQRRDREILASANKLLKENGILIYSTCTFSKEENEEMVKYLIDEFKYEV